jgi:hypothetical protein
MLDKDLKRLKTPYLNPPRPDDPVLSRVAKPLGLKLEEPVTLGDEIVADLDTKVHGIGWWATYSVIDRKTQILLSDYLVACVRAIPSNLVEAQVERLELDHAVEDYRKWMGRGAQLGRRFTVKPPQGPYEELSLRRVEAHTAGVLRAWGSALDCLGGCIVGVAGLPTDLVRADLGKARDCLDRQSKDSPVLDRLKAGLEQAEAQAGPAHWRDWLLGMRHTMVHRGRRTVTWTAILGKTGISDFTLQLPVSPELTDVEAAIRAGGWMAASFAVPAAEFLDQFRDTVGTYVSEASKLLAELWRRRRADPGLLTQSPRQWKQPQGLINPVPAFHGFPNLTQSNRQFTALDVGVETDLRLKAAGLTARDGAEHRPDPGVWS